MIYKLLSILAIMAVMAIITTYILNSMSTKTSHQNLRRMIVIGISILVFLVIALYLFTQGGYY
jgi:predicted PurR-regulated permease PerM